jgi:DNA-binding NarL/FixJ family response regulator
MALEQSLPERAIRHFAWADALREAVGVPVRLLARPRLQQELSRARAAIGPARSAEAWEIGRAMTFDQAVAYAIDVNDALPVPSATTHTREILSRREREVAALIALGYTNREIAEQLIISERTADGHVAKILSKLGLKTRSRVAVWAVAHGIAASQS